MSKEAMKLALEALEVATTPFARDRQEVLRAKAALREALAKPDFWEGYVPEPVKPAQPVAGQPLPCPFCGHIGLDFADGETYRWGVASCGGCGASCGDVRREYPDKGEWHTEAIAEWNKRSPAAQRKPLTDEEIWKFWWSRPEVPEGEDDSMEAEFVAAVRRVLAAHGIKENT